MLHYAQGLAASPLALYKFVVGKRVALPLFIFWLPNVFLHAGSAALWGRLS
jgi:hypothetical protein